MSRDIRVSDLSIANTTPRVPYFLQNGRDQVVVLDPG
jgi:hypothetical protein